LETWTIKGPDVIIEKVGEDMSKKDVSKGTLDRNKQTMTITLKYEPLKYYLKENDKIMTVIEEGYSRILYKV